jgi:NitT/TauT family transport system permease protein
MTMRLSRRHAAVTAVILGIVAIWEAGVWVFNVPALILPPPSAIVLNIVETWRNLLIHTAATTYEILTGFAAGAVIGIGTALLMTEFPAVRSSIYPVVIASQTIPKVAIAPLVIIWFGVGIYPKILIVALLAFFPILINTMAGFESTDRRHLELMRSVNASEQQVYWNIRFPTAVPHIFAGLKLGITASVIGAIIGEWVASTRGLGYLLLFYTQYLDMTSAFAVLVVLVLLGIACFALVEIVEQAMSWDSKIRKSRVGVIEAGL